jgi:hypothetical protein
VEKIPGKKAVPGSCAPLGRRIPAEKYRFFPHKIHSLSTSFPSGGKKIMEIGRAINPGREKWPRLCG